MKDQHEYLLELLKRIERLVRFTKDGRSAFMESDLIQDAVIRNFEVMGEVIKRLSPELTAQHPHIPWRQISGFRDVLIHDYEEIDLEVVWKALAEDIASLQLAVESMLKSLDS